MTNHSKRSSSTSSPSNSESNVPYFHHIHPDNEQNYARLLQYNNCYEAMPTSSKMVIFDSKLQLRKAFNGLIYQNTRHVLLSDPDTDGAIVGILSVTDFIRVMLRLYKKRKEAAKKDEASDGPVEGSTTASTTVNNGETSTNEEVPDKEYPNNPILTKDTAHLWADGDIGRLTIKEYREMIKSEGKLMNLITINADESLLKAARLLSKFRIHRLPVLDPVHGTPLFILTHKRLLKFMWLFGQSLATPDYRNKSCKELGVGTWSGIRVIFPDTLLADCLDILLHKGVSGLPVVERNTYRVVDMYSRFDAIGVALENKLDQLDVTVEQALAFRNTFREKKDRVVAIKDTDSLWTALNVLVERNVHRLCALRPDGAIEGLISLSDIINFMVVKPGADLSSSSSFHRRLNHHTSFIDEVAFGKCVEYFHFIRPLKLCEEYDPHSVLSRLEESAIQLEQRATGQINDQLAAFSMN
uniref:CBS domain-containing protein n=1 Tax=Syphacia muris TaxID=451379 RepID=A0A0N5ABL7_9BILA